MTPRLLALVAAASLAACTSPRARFEDVAGPEGLVEVLPSSADLEVDGAAAGKGSRTLAVRDPARVHRLRATAPGFEPAELAVAGEKLAGARVGLVLRPLGFGAVRPLDLDEPSGLSSAAALLLRAGLAREATEYAARAAALAPEAPAPRRILAQAHEASGERTRAIQEYSAYLSLAPADAPDRRDVERRVESLRGDLSVPGSGR